MKNKKFVKILALALSLMLVITAFAACGKKENAPQPNAPESTTGSDTPAASTDINRLTGLADISADKLNKRPVAVVVENHPDARPQWGLCSPDIVIEGLAEGGISRMMFVYSDVSQVAKIGPNRSARNNYIELAQGLDAIYVHFGGSYAAYNLMDSDKTIDHIDGSKGEGSYFRRDSSRKVSKEHTAYTTGEMLTQAIAAKGFRTDIKAGYEAPFKFASETRTLANPCQSIELAFSPSYKHTFKYNAEDKLYYNNMNSSPMVDADGKQMAVNNVIVIYCNVTPLNGDPKLVEWNLTSGKGLYISNGTYEEITWKKGGTHEKLQLIGADGNELQLNTGKSWIGFVPQGNQANIIAQ